MTFFLVNFGIYLVLALIFHSGSVTSEVLFICGGDGNPEKMNKITKDCCKTPNQVMSYDNQGSVCEASGPIVGDVVKKCCSVSGLEFEDITAISIQSVTEH